MTKTIQKLAAWIREKSPYPFKQGREAIASITDKVADGLALMHMTILTDDDETEDHFEFEAEDFGSIGVGQRSLQGIADCEATVNYNKNETCLLLHLQGVRGLMSLREEPYPHDECIQALLGLGAGWRDAYYQSLPSVLAGWERYPVSDL
ncbi:hypothetical protein SERLA73DRAFT_150290 [Serpula lacrymans var. lacrymans S7.3]|uniref:Uncharacterized protein n=1 Tax=Serpula lacrymans var. lacrymans (strain S7.3) TaxID=936435 RepID=F8PLX6_SERL3|nr:hypothetical protein SERLA73DRAFT_150290 [Serpula lacrymans var. lacrymans S7.3]